MKFRIVAKEDALSRALSSLIEKVTYLKTDLLEVQTEMLTDPEKVKAMDDAISACDLLSHHLLDIMEDSHE